MKAEPDICSAYNPYGHTCGEFIAAGRAAGHRGSSLANSLPKPVKYLTRKQKAIIHWSKLITITEHFNDWLVPQLTYRCAGARQVSQKSLVCWANTALPHHLIDWQNIRNTLANPSSSLSFQKVYCNVYKCKNLLGLLVYYMFSEIFIYF